MWKRRAAGAGGGEVVCKFFDDGFVVGAFLWGCNGRGRFGLLAPGGEEVEVREDFGV